MEPTLRRELDRIRRRDPELADELEATFRADEAEARAESIAAAVGRLERNERNARDLALENIIREVERPVLQVFRDEARLHFRDAKSEVWRDRLTAARANLGRAIRAVGRIEVEGHLNYDWVGTGFLACENVVVTNQHVAHKFAERKGPSKFDFRRNVGGRKVGAAIDFLEEHGRSEDLTFRIRDILYLETDQEPDLALLHVEPVDGKELPSPVPLFSGELVENQMVAAIGYPALDGHVPDQRLVFGIFGDVFDKKRLAPGRITGVADDLLRHDCSTLGKSSGSALVDLASGELVGVHFGGRFREANYAVPARMLVELLREVGCDPAAAPSRSTRGREASAVRAAPPSAVASVTVPIEVTVHVGSPVVAHMPPSGE